MSTDRLIRVNELLKREIASVLYREMAGTDFAFEEVTVTRVETASNLRTARVYVSIRGDDAEADRMLAALRRHRGRLQGFIRHDIVLKYTPVLQFVRDTSIALGDHVLDVLSKLPEPDDESISEPPPPAPADDCA
jgi:ribosome-binding factor A